MKTIKENNVLIGLEDQHVSPEKSKVFYNPRMQLSRELVLCSLTAYLSDRNSSKPVRCLDAFGATGVTGLQWIKHHGHKVDITICDHKINAVTNIQDNCILNGVKVKGDNESSGVEVICEDVNVLLHKRPFDFVHLDPFGCTVQYLDATFRNISNYGIVSISSTDTSALYSKCDRVTLRNYNALLCRTEYMKEVAVRLVVAAAVRAAARCNKGVDVLLSTAAEHFVLVILRVRRGPTNADACMQQLQRVMHCQMCMERTFVIPSLLVTDNPYKVLACDCHKTLPGATAACIGPVWSGSIFNADFVQKIISAARQHRLSKAVQQVMQVIIQEARCPLQKTGPSQLDGLPKQQCTQQLGKVSGDSRIAGMILESTSKDVVRDPNAMSAAKEYTSLNCRTSVNTEDTLGRTKPDDGCISAVMVGNNDAVEQVVKRQKTDHQEQICKPTDSISNQIVEEHDIDRETYIKSKHIEENGERLNNREENSTKDYGNKQYSKAPWDKCSYDQDLAFFYNMHNHSAKDSDSPKLDVLIANLHQSGFRASRTHFDKQGVRTNASKANFSAVLSKCSPPTRK